MGAPSTFPLPRKARAQVRPEINVTPLVDVVLVLLIIFMVIAPLPFEHLGEYTEAILAADVVTEHHI